MDGTAPRPFGALAELTFRCPLHCPYCSNPTAYPGAAELSAPEWSAVFHQAAALGVVQALLSGGEPLLRPDLDEIVASARAAGLYTNLITSGVGLTSERAAALRDAGLDSVQISFQADRAGQANQIAGARAHGSKLKAAGAVTQAGLPLTLNVVLHRANIGRVDGLVELAEQLSAIRIELANVQLYGWASRNRAALLPTREQVLHAHERAVHHRERLRGKMQVLWVLPDYFARRPKPCMFGWGRRMLTVNPVGDVLPCPTSTCIPGLCFDSVRRRPLEWIWHHSEAFERFRGADWMREPCRSCDLREVDFGGCRCQAALLAGDGSRTDPACELSPDHHLIEKAVGEASAAADAWVYRANPTGNRRCGPAPQ